jgi:hypothetical protein
MSSCFTEAPPNNSFNRNPHRCSRLRWQRSNIRLRTDPRRVRLTQALGGRKAFGSCVACCVVLAAPLSMLFGWFAGSFSLRLRYGARSRVASVVLAGFGNNDRLLFVLSRRTRSFGDGRRIGCGARSGSSASALGCTQFPGGTDALPLRDASAT